MALVAVIDVLLDAKLLEQQHTADAEQNLLLQTILPVAAIEGMSDGLVELGVHLVVGIEQIEFHATYIDAPNVCMHMIVHIRNVNNHWRAIFVHLLFDGQ